VEGVDNGGFPEPLAGEAVRLVHCDHDACGATTRVRLPRVLSATAVRRVVCDGCRQSFECDNVLDLGVDAWPRTPSVPQAPPPRRPGFQSRAWRYLSVPVAAAAVVGALALIQGWGKPAGPPASSAAPTAPEPPFRSDDNTVVGDESSFALALPPGWRRTATPSGATFAAAPTQGGASATLWILREPQLDFEAFESRSLAQLEAIAGSAQVIDRATAPAAAGTVVTLGTAFLPGEPQHQVTLRVVGDYGYYLATTVEPDARREAVDGADMIHDSFVPVAGSGAG
jgi:hypothetical protein